MTVYRVKEEGEYPWPSKNDPERTIKLFTDDQLTQREGGTYMKHTGIACINIQLKDDDIEIWEDPPELVLA